MSTVGLNRATRETLTTLRQANDQAAAVSQRLATGKRVNSALEDPSVYFNALSLSAKSAEMDRSLEQVGQGVQVLKTADKGLAAIGKLLETLKSVVDQAKASDDAFRRSDLANEFNEVLRRIEEVAADSDYRGKNLLAGEGNDLKLYFGDERTDAIFVESVDYTKLASGLGLADLVPGKPGVSAFNLMDSGGVALDEKDTLSKSPDFPVGTTISVNFAGPPAATKSLTVTPTTKVSELIQLIGDKDRGGRATVQDNGTVVVEALADLTLTGGPFTGTTISPSEAGSWTARFTVDMSPAVNPIETAADAVRKATVTMRAQAATFGTSLTLLQNRESFMTEFSRSLLAGAEEFVGADMNAEAANLLALQLRQQLSTNALSIGKEADQGVLRLLGG